MTDISMCQNDSWEMASKCYRFLAIQNPVWQSYFEFNNICKAPKFEYFISIGSSKARKEEADERDYKDDWSRTIRGRWAEN